jgi:hypothetical protein
VQIEYDLHTLLTDGGRHQETIWEILACWQPRRGTTLSSAKRVIWHIAVLLVVGTVTPFILRTVLKMNGDHAHAISGLLIIVLITYWVIRKVAREKKEEHRL